MAEWEQRFKGVDLQSEGHVRPCEALEAAGLLFSFELHICIPEGATGTRRTLDLLVISSHGLLNVEIDGARHNKTKRRDKDYDRDRLLSRHLRTLRFTHEAVLSDPQAVARTIQLELEEDRRSLFQQLNGP